MMQYDQTSCLMSTIKENIEFVLWFWKAEGWLLLKWQIFEICHWGQNMDPLLQSTEQTPEYGMEASALTDQKKFQNLTNSEIRQA